MLGGHVAVLQVDKRGVRARRAQVGETYDWRLSVPNMEKRDRYFTRLKWRIELTHYTTGEKVLPRAAHPRHPAPARTWACPG